MRVAQFFKVFILFTLFSMQLSCEKEEQHDEVHSVRDNVTFTLKENDEDEAKTYSFYVTYSIEETQEVNFSGTNQYIGGSESIHFSVFELKEGSFEIGAEASLRLNKQTLFGGSDNYEANNGSITITEISTNNQVSGSFAVFRDNFPLLNQGYTITGTFKNIPKI